MQTKRYAVTLLVLVGCSNQGKGLGADAANGGGGGGGGGGGNVSDDYEGDDPGECGDGADNDRDGYFDCKDNGCWGSPLCDETEDADSDSDADGDADTDTDTDADSTIDTTPPCTEPICDLTAVTYTYKLQWDFSNFEGFGGICDCVMAFTGDGAVSEVDPVADRVSFEGTWTPTNYPSATTGTDTAEPCGALDFCPCPPPEDPCSETFWSGVWWDKVDGAAYNTYRFDAGMTELLDWVAHASAATYLPSDDPLNDQQFYITNLFSPYNHADTPPIVHYYFVEVPNDPDLAILGTTVTHDLTVEFAK